MKLCVFQGTFNPVHNAHIRVVNFILKNYEFDKIIVIPAYKPPHKNYDTSLSFHRLNMAKIAFENMAEVSDIEYKREGKSYTYLTICELYEKYKIDGKINFVIGTDAFKYIETWYEANKLKELVKFIVFERENDFFQEKYDYLKAKGYDFEIESLSFEDISSSDLRLKIKNGEDITGYLPQQVKDYIEQYGLYKDRYGRNTAMVKRKFG